MEAILTLERVGMYYSHDKKDIVSIKDVSFSVNRNEFVSIIGPSGCGKSTIVKMILDLVKPTSGRIVYAGGNTHRTGSISVVFQNAALFPWLTVQENVELVLEALERDRKGRTERALKYIRMVGLDGFEDAYPRELSGGMKQRVSLARALSTAPDLLLLDEPFSSLDVFAAQALREELLDLWENPEMPPRTIIMVTHNVDEAVQMSDRIIVLSSRPSYVKSEMSVSLLRPRNTRSEEFYQTVDAVLTEMSK
ncbi:MAG: ABC transporter ATP-binding protein [Thermoplasmataceae archaeon]